MSKQKMLTSTQAQQVFGVSAMTLLAWRRGTRTRSALPAIEGLAGRKKSILFKASDLLSWARRNFVTIEKTPQLVLGLSAGARMPGPKPKLPKPGGKDD